MTTPTDIIRAAQLEPITLVQSVSRSWHVLRDQLDGGTYARTDCHREVKVKEIKTCTVADVAYHREPTGGKYCCACEWSHVRFGSAWETVVAEICLRAATGILEADQREFADAWGVPVRAVEGVLTNLTFGLRGKGVLDWEHVVNESRRADGWSWGRYFLKK